MYCSIAILHDSASISVWLSSGRRRKSKSSTSKKEEKLLKQLRQITQLMQEGRLEAASPEMEAEEVPYSADWEGTRLKSESPSSSHHFTKCTFIALIVADFVSRAFKYIFNYKKQFYATRLSYFYFCTLIQATQRRPTQCMMIPTKNADLTPLY